MTMIKFGRCTIYDIKLVMSKILISSRFGMDIIKFS